jgi:hypothetical protein
VVLGHRRRGVVEDVAVLLVGHVDGVGDEEGGQHRPHDQAEVVGGLEGPRQPPDDTRPPDRLRIVVLLRKHVADLGRERHQEGHLRRDQRPQSHPQRHRRGQEQVERRAEVRHVEDGEAEVRTEKNSVRPQLLHQRGAQDRREGGEQVDHGHQQRPDVDVDWHEVVP